MTGDWEKANLFVSRFLASLQMGIVSSKNPYVDDFIATLDCGLMTTATMLNSIAATRKALVACKNGYANIPTSLYLLLCGDFRNDKFLKLVTGKDAQQWSADFRRSNAECGVVF